MPNTESRFRIRKPLAPRQKRERREGARTEKRVRLLFPYFLTRLMGCRRDLPSNECWLFFACDARAYPALSLAQRSAVESDKNRLSSSSLRASEEKG